MFVSACPGGGASAGPGFLWTDMSSLAAALYPEAPDLDPLKRPPPAYFSDLFYPSVIPLAGTLPSPPPIRSVLPPAVRSRDLKFGIDRILQAKATGEQESSPPPPPAHFRLLGPKTPYPGPPATSPPGPRLYGPPPPLTSPMTSFPRVPPPAHLYQPRELCHRPDFPGAFGVLGSGESSSPSSPPKRKRSWSRAVFSALQRKGLEKRFEVQKYVTKPDRRQLAAMLGLTDAQVKVWFQNRRMKWRHAEEQKKKKEAEEKKEESKSSPAKEETPAEQEELQEEDSEDVPLEIEVEMDSESEEEEEEAERAAVS